MFIFVFFVLCLSGVLCQDPSVNIKHGALRGKWQESTNGRRFAGFWGIPYAKPPIGEYRFREPQPLQPWLGVWDATRELSHCLQWEPTAVAIVGAEDCLFLNVFTPDLSPKGPLPVVVYIHSGAFMFGSGSLYGPAHLMDRDLVLVTINYRLGPLGFLSTGDEVISGNAGLKDQAFALKWVQENIREFGGDPNSVTLTGCSAGSASVHYQYLSPLSKGTFHRGIAFSGSAFAPWAYAPKPAKNAKALAKLVGCPYKDMKEMAECLRRRPGEVIINAMVQMFEWHAHMFTPFLPTLEVSTAREPFITEYPYFAAQAGTMHRLPLVATMTAAEGLYPAAYYQKNPSYLQEIEDKWEVMCSNLFEYNDTATLCQRPGIAKKIKEEYLGGKPVSQETFPQLVEAMGDRHFGMSIARLVTSHARAQSTYMYKYSHHGQHSLSHHISKNKNYYGVSHADDIMEIFQFLWTSTSDADVKMREALLDMIYSFASTGVPKFPNAPEWTPVKPNSPEVEYLEIFEHDKYEIKSEADIGRQKFWDGLGLKEYNNYHSLIREEL